MTLPNSGPISLNAVATEFGGAAPHSLSEYYGVASGVPSSGTISLSQFYGKSAGFRYWRVRITSAYPSGSDSYTWCGELQLREIAGDEASNRLPGILCTDSPLISNRQRYTDNSVSLVATTSNVPVNLAFDLGVSRRFSELAWYVSDASYVPASFHVEASNDGTSYTTIKSFSPGYGPANGWVLSTYRLFSLI